MDDRLKSLELEAANAKQRLDDTFNIFVGLGGLATIGLGFFGFLTWFRGEQQADNYKRERNYYEDSQKEERRENRREREFFERMQRVDRLADLREQRRRSRTETERDQIGINTASKELENLAGLGKVIDLVREASQIKLDREKSQEKLESLIKNISDDAEQRYGRVVESVGRFERDRVTARQWPSLPEERRRVASNACRTFEQIHDFVLNEKKESSKLGYAKLLHFLGIFSYYADHNVDAALNYLGQANELFGDGDVGDFRYNQAYTKHFLGILKKNWHLRLEPHGTSLRDAERYLEAAERFLAIETGQYLTAITHAEVLSYSDEGRALARPKLEQILKEHKSRPQAEKGAEARAELIPRVYLLLGNLSWYDSDRTGAAAHYDQGISLNPNDPYLLFSRAQVTDNEGASQHWQDGLKNLRRPPATEKPETVTRVLIFAWGAVAAHHARNQALENTYVEALKNLGSGIEREGKYAPSFFSPITKTLVDFNVLWSEIVKELGLNANPA
jgi:hypothetical protein